MRFSKWISLTLLVLIALIPAAAQDDMMHAAPELYVIGAWARATALPEMMDMDAGDMGGDTETTEEATPEGESMDGMGGHSMPVTDNGVSAAYMLIENPGDVPVTLVSASTAYAELVEIHETRMDGDVMQMRQVEGGIEVPAGGTAELKPRGYHVMLMGLKMPLVAGSAIGITLTFEYAGMNDTVETFDVVIGAPVLQEAPEAPALDVVTSGAWARPTAPAIAMPANKMDMSGEVNPDAPDTADNGDMGDTTEGGEMGDMGGSMNAMGGVSAAYMVLLNRTDAALKIVSAESPAAAEVQIHETVVENDMAMMRELEAGLDLPAGERVELKPGGIHIMLLDLVAPIAPGQAVLLTLTFETGETLTLAVPVYDKGEAGMMMH